MTSLAAELMTACENRRIIQPPSARDDAFDLTTAYAIAAEIAGARRALGHETVGWKVAYASEAKWRELKLETVAWAPMYDDTVRYADWNDATLSIASMFAPKIEPEIVFKLAQAPASSDPVAVLEATEWIALGFEIIDCVFPDWKVQPVDFVAARGMHAALVVGEPIYIEPGNIARLVTGLAEFTVRVLRNNQLVAEGAGKNVLQSPARCVGELTAAMKRRGGETLRAGEVVSTGSLTSSMMITAGDTWIASLSGIPPSALTLRVS